MIYKHLFKTMVILGSLLSATVSTTAQEGEHQKGKDSSKLSQASQEAQCEVKAIYELKVSEDGKSLDVFNEAGDIVSSLTVAQLAGLGEKSRRFLLTDESCMTVGDKALLSLIESNPKEEKQGKTEEVNKETLFTRLAKATTELRKAGIHFLHAVSSDEIDLVDESRDRIAAKKAIKNYLTIAEKIIWEHDTSDLGNLNPAWQIDQKYHLLMDLSRSFSRLNPNDINDDAPNSHGAGRSAPVEAMR